MMCDKIIFRFPINDLLYVINHAYDTIGDVIEVFQVEQNKENKKLYLKHQSSYTLGMLYNGSLNDLAVVDENNILIAQFRSDPDPVEGAQARGIFKEIIEIVKYAYRIKESYIL